MIAVTGPTIKRGKSDQGVSTPWAFVHAVEQKFWKPIAFDLAATLSNSKAEFAGMHFSPADDSLTKHWHLLQGLLWLNPPYSDITPWARKCAEEMKKGAEILLLAPMGGQNWYWDWVEPYAQVYSVGRITFDGSKDPYPKDLVLCHYKPGLGHAPERMQRWKWRSSGSGGSLQ